MTSTLAVGDAVVTRDGEIVVTQFVAGEQRKHRRVVLELPDTVRVVRARFRKNHEWEDASQDADAS